MSPTPSPHQWVSARMHSAVQVTGLQLALFIREGLAVCKMCVCRWRRAWSQALMPLQGVYEALTTQLGWWREWSPLLHSAGKHRLRREDCGRVTVGESTQWSSDFCPNLQRYITQRTSCWCQIENHTSPTPHQSQHPPVLRWASMKLWISGPFLSSKFTL